MNNHSISTTFRYLSQSNWASVTIVNKKSFFGIFSFNRRKTTIQIHGEYRETQQEVLITSETLSFLASCGNDHFQDHLVPPKDPYGKDEGAVDAENQSPRQRSLKTLTWYGGSRCFKNDDIPRRFHIGIVADQSLEARSVAEGFPSVSKFIETVVASASSIYLNQMNIEIVVDQILTRGSASNTVEFALTSPTRISKCLQQTDTLTGEILETDCCSDSLSLSGRLELMQSWVESLGLQNNHSNKGVNQTPSRLGHWHLFTDCHPPPGSVGKTYIGTLCHSTHFAGITSYGLPTDPFYALWRMFAHEIGHAFNSSHSFEYGIGMTGGIMDYGNGKYLDSYQIHPFKQKEVCSEIQTQVDSCIYFEFMNPICGDGIVQYEIGEECECVSKHTTTCEDCINCQLVKTSQCVRSSACCNDDGTFAFSSKSCQIGAQTGVCIRGTCQVNVCPWAKFTPCKSNECQVSCVYPGSPCSSSSLTNLPNGIPCSNGTCHGGVSKSKINFANNE